MNALTHVLKEEGFRSKPYLDTVGVPTFGHGLTFITEEESTAIVQARIYDIYQDLYDKYSWFRNLSETRQAVLISMVFQLGITGFSKFKKMIAAIEIRNYSRAGSEMRDSKAYTQTQNRWDRQIELFVKG